MFTRIDHVGIAVQDLDAAISFYEEKFGLKAVHVETNEEQGVREAMLAVGDSGSCIQLLAPLRPDSPIGKFLARNGEGIQQMAYGVDDMDATCAQLRSTGVRLLYDTPKRGTAGSRVNFVHPKDAGRAQLGAGRVHVVHAVGHLLDALAVAGQELADRGD